MNESDLIEDLKRQFGPRFMWITTSLMDAIFLVLWIILQNVVNMVTSRFQLSGLDDWILQSFQILFAISTLAPILMFIYKDLTIMFKKFQQEIKYIEKNTAYESSQRGRAIRSQQRYGDPRTNLEQQSAHTTLLQEEENDEDVQPKSRKTTS